MAAASHQHSFLANPLLPLVSAFATGIVLNSWFQPKLGVLLVITATLTLVSITCVWQQRLTVGSCVTTLALLFIGACFAKVENDFVPLNKVSQLLESGQIPSDKSVVVIGLVEGPVETSPDAVHLTLRAQKVLIGDVERVVKGLVATTILTENGALSNDELNLRHGARLRLRTKLDREDRFRNPGVSGLGEFLDHRGFEAIAFVKSPSSIERLPDDPGIKPITLIYDWRRRLEERIVATFSRDTAGVLNASLLGNRYGLSLETSNKFREGGTFHVLVISGLHISFLGGVVFALACRITNRRTVRFLVSTISLWVYALAVGANASVVRAAFMFTFVSFAPIVRRRAASLNSLSAAALLLLIWRPRELFDPSFQLTFLSVFAIVAFSWPLLTKLALIGRWRPTSETPHPPLCSEGLRFFAELLYWSDKGWRRELSRSSHKYRLFKAPFAATLEGWHLQPLVQYTFAALVVSSSVQIVLMPLLVLHFHRVSLAAFVLNIGVSALMILLSFVAVLALLVDWFNSAVAMPLVLLTNALNWLTVNSVVPFSHFQIASLRIPEYSGKAVWLYPLYFAPLICLAIALGRWRPLDQPQTDPGRRRGFRHRVSLLIVLQLLCVFLIVAHPLSAQRPNKLRVEFLDVGQGDAALVTMPDGTTLLVDAGGRTNFRPPKPVAEPFQRDMRSIGEGVVSEFLWNRGLDRVHYILPTHADADHIDGLNDVVRNFSVRAALVGREPVNDVEFEKFRVTTSEHAVPHVTLGAGDTLQFGNVFADVFWPPTASANARSRNDDSVVLRIRMGDRSILLTGDIESASELALIRSGQKLAVDVVKVAHHGSRTSSIEKFVSASHPRYAIISVGRKSMFGHPHAEVVQRWINAGAQVLTTGNCGMISVETDGSALDVSTFVDCGVR